MTCLYQVSYLRLHQVSYLRLRDELGVCLSYCCLSNTTCVLVVIQYTAVYLVYICHIPKISLYYCYCCVLGILYHSCVCRGSVIIELVSRMNSQRGCWVCWKSKKTYFYEILTPGIISAWCVCSSYCCLSGTTCVSVIIQYNITTSPLLLSTSHNVYTCHSPKYHYIIVTVVYLVYCIIAVCVEVLWS